MLVKVAIRVRGWGSKWAGKGAGVVRYMHVRAIAYRCAKGKGNWVYLRKIQNV